MDTANTLNGFFNSYSFSDFDREEYERNLKERQRKHLEKVRGNNQQNWQPCMHDGCPDCHGTGIKTDGTSCVHMLSCPCPKCNPFC